MVTEPSPAQVDRIRRLLAHEGADGSAAEGAAAAGRVYEKLEAHLAPLVGAAGVRALLVRSAKLTHRRFSFLEVADVESARTLRECLQSQTPAVAAESAATLFGVFFALITNFVGERLTTQVLRRAWPTLEEIAPATTAESVK